MNTSFHIDSRNGESTRSPTAAPKSRGLRIIAVLKFIEAIAVAAAGLATLKLLNPATLDLIAGWVQAVPGAAAQQFLQGALDHLSGISHRQVRALGAGAFIFAAIFLVEGIGLWMEKRWAEWLAIVATALFIPLEILELIRHVTAPKAVALIVNVLVVAYLVARIINDRRHDKAA
jgi:uncharacterized membrane protein (DUF2068 family)